MYANVKYIDAENINFTAIADPEVCKMSMFEGDTAGVLQGMGKAHLHEIIYLQSIHYASEEQKREFIAWLTSNNPDAVIITEAYASTEEYPESEYYLGEPEEGKKPLPLDEILTYEGGILEDLGFVSVNNYIKYEHKIAYIYNNEIGREMKERMDKLADCKDVTLNSVN